MNYEIDYADKVALNQNSNIPDINKVNDTDMNQIKNKHNGVMSGTISMGNIRVDSIESKNLFNKNNVFIGIIYANGSIGSNETTYRYTEYIPITKNKITLSGINTSGGGNIIEYNSNKEKIDNWSTSNRTLTLNSNTKYIRFSLSINDLNTAQLEYGESATPYSPHQELNNQEVYSTSEIKIGFWIDGKPLYRAYLVAEEKTGTSVTYTYNMSSYNIDTFVKGSGVLIRSNISLYVPSDTNAVTFDNSTHTFNVYMNNSTSRTFSGYFFVEYTKTTD